MIDFMIQITNKVQHINVQDSDEQTTVLKLASVLVDSRVLPPRDAKALAISLGAYSNPKNISPEYRVICRFTGYGHIPVQISVRYINQPRPTKAKKTSSKTSKPSTNTVANTANTQSQQYIYKVQLRNAPNSTTSITARSYIDAVRKTAKKLGCIFDDFVQTTTDNWSFHVQKYNTADTSIPVGEKYFRAKTQQDN